MKGHIEEVRAGVWRAWIDLPRGEDGKRKQKKLTIHATGKRDADNQLAKLVADANAGRIAAATKETVESYLTAWLKKREADGLAPKTLENWRHFLRAHVGPHLGKTTLEKLTPRQVDDFYGRLRTSGRKSGEGGLSGQTILHIHRMLSEALKHAVRMELIPRNVCDLVEPPRAEREEREPLDAAGLVTLLVAAEGTWLHVPVVLAAGMGLRRGEVLGLRWTDVDFKAGTLTVYQAAQKIAGEELTFRAPKKKSRRTISLPEFVAEALRQHKGQQAAHRLQIGEAWTDTGLVVTNEDGTPRRPDNLTQAFVKLLRRAGLPAIHFHDLRHTNATLLLLAKVDVKVISERLGHSGTQITRDLYQHVLPSMDAEAARLTDDFFRQALGG